MLKLFSPFTAVGRVCRPSSLRLFSAEAVAATKTAKKPHVNIGTIGHVDHGKTVSFFSLI
jgi:GTPase